MKKRYARPALADLRNVLDYIEAQSPSASRKVAVRLKALIELARHHPEIGRQTDEPGIRRIVARPYPYLIFYETT